MRTNKAQVSAAGVRTAALARNANKARAETTATLNISKDRNAPCGAKPNKFGASD